MTDGLPVPRRYLAILVISLGNALVVIDGTIVTIALPTVASDLNTSPSAAVMVVTVYQLLMVMTLLPFANLGDRIGLRRVYLAGQALFAFATLLCFLAPNLPFLLMVRALQAVGAAASISVSAALLRQIYPSSRFGRGLGVNSVVTTASAVLAPALGGLILEFASWPWVFASTIPFALLTLVLGRSLPDPVRREHPFDVTGALLCAMTFGILIAGLQGAAQGAHYLVSWGLVALGLAIGIAFVRYELSEARPILPLDLLRRPIIALSTIGGFAVFMYAQVLMVSLPFTLQHVHGFSPSEIGAMIGPWPLAMMVVGPIAGSMSDRYPPGLLGGLGMLIAIMGTLSLAFLPSSPHFFDVAWRTAMMGVAIGFFVPPTIRLIVSSVESERSAAASGLVSTNTLVAQALGATLAAALLAHGVGEGAVPGLTAAAIAAFAGLCSVILLMLSLRGSSWQAKPVAPRHE